MFVKDLLVRNLFVNQFMEHVTCNQIKVYVDEWKATCNAKLQQMVMHI